MKNLNEKEFREMVNSETLSVIKYSASWCGPCRVLTPVMEGIIPKYEDVNFGEVDIDQNRTLAMEQNIRSVPTVLFFKKGEIVNKVVGLKNVGDYESMINSLK